MHSSFLLIRAWAHAYANYRSRYFFVPTRHISTRFEDNVTVKRFPNPVFNSAPSCAVLNGKVFTPRDYTRFSFRVNILFGLFHICYSDRVCQGTIQGEPLNVITSIISNIKLKMALKTYLKRDMEKIKCHQGSSKSLSATKEY